MDINGANEKDKDNFSYSAAEKELLLRVAHAAIKYGLEHHKMLPALKLEDYPAKLKVNCASFVTLEIDGELRGCIGSLEAHQSLITDIAQNAFYAAFHDSRFLPLSRDEYPHIEIHISILSAPQAMHFSSEKDLLAQLRPHIDGLILSDKGCRGTFLPLVWEQLPEPQLFLQHLKIKAGLPADYWSKTLKVERYTAEVL